MSSRTLTIGTLLWILVVGAGIYRLGLYENQAGEVESPPSQLPVMAFTSVDPTLPQLIVFAHPHCPCSRASIGELARIGPQVHQPFETTVLFFAPSEFDPTWSQTSIVEAASRIPGTRVLLDKDGAISRQFNATISGETMLYGSDGTLRFWGGITAARGHAGDNTGRSAVQAILNGQSPSVTHTSTFGCHLFNRSKSTTSVKTSEHSSPSGRTASVRPRYQQTASRIPQAVL